MSKYEDLYPADEFAYLTLWKAYTERGLEIPNGTKIQLTPWAVENGLGGNKYGVKIGNTRGAMGSIRVRLNGNKHPTSYWAGFWQSKN